MSASRLFIHTYLDLSLTPTILPRPTETDEKGSGGQMETMLNPLWPGFELVMAGTSAEVPLPPVIHTYPDLSLSPTIPPRPIGTGKEGPGGQTEIMLNPLWSGFELVMADTSTEVPLPPDHETQLQIYIYVYIYIYVFSKLLKLSAKSQS
ncbi:hypothetical protein YC2023_090166 [Brassica napus]